MPIVIPKQIDRPLTTEFIEDFKPDFNAVNQKTLDAIIYDSFRRVAKKHGLNVEPDIPLSEKAYPEGFEYFYTMLLISRQLFHNLSRGLPLDETSLDKTTKLNSRFYKAYADCTYLTAIFTDMYTRNQIKNVEQGYYVTGRIFINSFGSSNLIGIIALSISQEAEHYVDVGRDMLFDVRNRFLSG